MLLWYIYVIKNGKYYDKTFFPQTKPQTFYNALYMFLKKKEIQRKIKAYIQFSVGIHKYWV